MATKFAYRVRSNDPDIPDTVYKGIWRYRFTRIPESAYLAMVEIEDTTELWLLRDDQAALKTLFDLYENEQHCKPPIVVIRLSPRNYYCT